MKKTCSLCRVELDRSCFYGRKSAANGLRSQCKNCLKKFQDARKADKLIYDKGRYAKNKESVNAKARAYYHENRESKLAYDRNRRSLVAEQRRQRYKTDLTYKLVCNLRSRLYCALRRNTKADSAVDLLGCSVDDLKLHLSSLFTDGMSWDKVMNGEIHIDHIKPCVKFDLSDPAEQRKCFHYTNLQPLWAKENFQKHVSYPAEESSHVA